MPTPILIAHAPGEEEVAEQVAGPLRSHGYDVLHAGTVLVGDSVTAEYSKHIAAGSPVVLCGTVKALGTGWAYRVAHAVRAANSGSRLFALQIEREAYVEALALDAKVAPFWQDPARAIAELLTALQRFYGDEGSGMAPSTAEARYRELALESCDIIDLANLPENDRHIATRQLELRRLYVSLRVRVPSSTREPAEDEIGIFLQFIEGWGFELQGEEQDLSIGQLLQVSRQVVVLGDPGSGKTTMLRWLATAYLLRLNDDPDWKSLPDIATLPERDWLPIIVRCRDLDEESVLGTLEDVLGHTLRKAELTDTEARALRSVIVERLARGTGLLLIDGLDEIAGATTRARFAQQIERIAIAYPTAPIVATSRVVGYREMGYRIGRNFVHATVADLTKQDKDEFARRWCAVTELPERREAAAQELIHDIHSTDRIERLTGNPMLLTTMALVKRKVGRLPNRRADLYLNALQVLLNWRREVDEPIDDREAIPQLQYLAYAMCERGAQQFRRDEVIDAFEAFKQEHPQVRLARRRPSEEFLQLLERRTAMLVEAGHTRHDGQLVPVYEFRHLTFQEYLAGLALISGYHPGYDRAQSVAQRVAPIAARISSSDDAGVEQWREALRLCAASCNDRDVDDVIRAIATPNAGDTEDVLESRMAMAVLCLADEPNVSENVGAGILDDAIKLLSDFRYRDLRKAIQQALHSTWLDHIRAQLRTVFPTGVRDVWGIGALMRDAAQAASSQQELALPERLAEALTGADDVACEAAIDITALIESNAIQSIDEHLPQLMNLLRRNRPHTIYAATSPLETAADHLAWRMPSETEELIIALLEADDTTDDNARRLLSAAQSGRTQRLARAALRWLTSARITVRFAGVEMLGAIGHSAGPDQVVADRLHGIAEQDPDIGLRRRAKEAFRLFHPEHRPA